MVRDSAWFGRLPRVDDMNAADRHVLDLLPVPLQVWDADTLRYANEAAERAALPDLRAASLAQAPASLELDGDDGSCWQVQITPLGGTSVLAAYTDITARKQHERSLVASERLNREILSGLQEGVVVVDTDARVVVANEAAAELIGVPLSELSEMRLSGVPVDLLDDRGQLLGRERLPLMRALRGEEV